MPTVNLSALAGAGQQFFDNNGNPLSGGKLHSYAAGTTTPQTTYTSATGATAHTNPIVLDSAGRVATGEIWLTAGQNYKFVLKTSTEVTIATWDNITGINGTGIATNADNVEYDPPFTGAVTSNYTVQEKLAQTISPEDFGAVGNGIVDDTSAVQAAFDFAFANDLPICASKIYLINGTLIINKSVVGFPPAFVFGGGTFKKNNAGTMFKGGNLYTGVLFFDNISFVANPAVNVIAFECAPDLIRTYFSQCSFQFFDVCFSGNSGTSTYIQTLRLVNCSFGQIKSWVIDTGDSATNTAPNGYVFDASIYGCSFEAFTTGGVCRAFPFRFSCKDSVIEDFVTKPAFYFNGAVATDICNNYTENIFGGFVEFKSTGLGVNGFSISNNLGWTTAGVPFIKWPPSLFANPVSINNNVNGAGPIHDTSLVTFGYVSSLNDYHVSFVANIGSALRTVPSQLSGTYTPVVAGETSAGVGTYTTQFGVYNIVGNTVTVTVTMDWTAHTGTGNLYITLPTNPRTGIFVANVSPSNLTVPTGRVLSAATDFGGANRVYLGTLRTDGSGGGFNNLSLASYTSGSLSLTITYTT